MAEARVCLIRIMTSEGQRSHLIDKPAFTVGRAQEADLPILAAGVSRLHLRVELRGDAVWINDQKSANGTYINGKKLEPGHPVLIAPGDIVKLGSDPHEFHFMAIPKPFELLNKEAKTGDLLESMEELAKKVELESKEKVEKELRWAKTESEQILAQARKEAEVLKTQGMLALQKEKQDLEAQIAHLQQELKMGTATERMNARRDADRMIAEAQKRIQQDYDGASQQMEARFKEVQNRCMKMLEEAEVKAQEVLAAAQSEASEVRREASEEARAIHNEALRKVQESTASMQEDFQKEVKQKRDEILMKARLEAEAERERILIEVRTQDERRNAARAEIEKIETARGKLVREMESLDSEVVAARKLLMEVNELEGRKVRAEAEFKQFVKSREDGVAKIEAELKELRDKGLIEVTNRRRDQEQEIAKERLKAIEDIKKEIERREQDYDRTRKLRAMELGQKLEEKLIPQLQNWIKEPGRAPSEMKAAIEAAVTENLAASADSFQPRADVAEGAAPVKVDARKKRFMRIAFAGLGAVVALAAVNHETVATYFRNGEENSYAKQVMDDRKARSIYTPEQTGEFRDTYTDNVLYMTGYFQTKTDPNYIEKWTLRLNDLALLRSMGLSEEDIVRFIAKEINLVQRLGALRESIDAVYLSEGLERMRKAEQEDLVEIKSILKGDQNLASIRKIEQDFMREFQSKASMRVPTGQ